eukprot:2338086-Prymnesium_polylepis.1
MVDKWKREQASKAAKMAKLKAVEDGEEEEKEAPVSVEGELATSANDATAMMVQAPSEMAALGRGFIAAMAERMETEGTSGTISSCRSALMAERKAMEAVLEMERASQMAKLEEKKEAPPPEPSLPLMQPPPSCCPPSPPTSTVPSPPASPPATPPIDVRSSATRGFGNIRASLSLALSMLSLGKCATFDDMPSSSRTLFSAQVKNYEPSLSAYMVDQLSENHFSDGYLDNVSKVRLYVPTSSAFEWPSQVQRPRVPPTDTRSISRLALPPSPPPSRAPPPPPPAARTSIKLPVGPPPPNYCGGA